MCAYRFFISCCLGLWCDGSSSLKLLLGELPGVWLMIVVSLMTRRKENNKQTNKQRQTLKSFSRLVGCL